MTKPRLSQRRQDLTPGHVSSTLTLAELCFQRGDYAQASELLQHRLGRGSDDFKTRNLLGISKAYLGQFLEAETLFHQLSGQVGRRQQKDKAVFNLGLVRLYQDLARYGDMTVASTLESAPGNFTSGEIPTESPFSGAIRTWQTLVKRNSPHKEITLSFLSFAFLQYGDIDKSLEYVTKAIMTSETFFLTQYVLGRLFLDLFYLAREGNAFLLPKPAAAFFEVEDYEITRIHRGRFAVHPDTYLDIALQAFLEGRAQAPTSPVLLNYLCQTYLLADMYEEAREVLTMAESLAPDWLMTLKLSLKFQEAIQASPEVIRTLIRRIDVVRRQGIHKRIFEVLPPHYLI